MKGTFRIAVVSGIEVAIHWTLLAFAALYLLSPWPGDGVVVGLRAGFVVILFASVLLHEFGHSFTGRFCDGASDKIVLWPLGGLSFVHLPDSPLAHLLTALAGPLVSLSLSLVGFWVKSFTADWMAMGLGQLAQINFALCFFNLLPAHPMDGGRILHALLWKRMGYERAMWVCVHVSLVVGGGLLAWVLFQPGFMMETMMGSAVALYVLFNAWQQRQMLQYRQEGEEFWSSRPGVPHNHPYRTWEPERRRDEEEPEPEMTDDFIKKQVDPILDKISREGMQSLTRRERKILESARDLMQKHQR